MQRPDWDEYFMEMVDVVKKRSTCIRRQVGAVLVKDNRIISTGYNGAPSKLEHAATAGCLREQKNIPSGSNQEVCRGVHAEQNTIIQAAVYGVPIGGATLYCNTKPCSICTKMLINAQIKRIVYLEKYDDELADTLLQETDIRVVQYKK